MEKNHWKEYTMEGIIVLRNAYSKKWLSKVERIMRRFDDITFREIEDYGIFSTACKRNDGKFMQFVVDHCELTEEMVMKRGGLLDIVCSHNCDEMAQCFLNKFNTKIDTAFLDMLLCRALERRHFKIIKWIYKNFQLPYKEGIIQHAVHYGDIYTSTWAVGKFGTECSKAEAALAFRYACECRLLSSIKYIAERFDIDKSMIDLEHTLKRFCRPYDVQWYFEDQLEGFRWFIGRLNITLYDIRECNTLQHICTFVPSRHKIRQIQLGQWLIDHFELTPADAGKYASMFKYKKGYITYDAHTLLF